LSDENHSAARDSDPSGQDEFAATLDPSGELIELRLKPDNFFTITTVVHACHIWTS
jgi:hypothetical protein